MYSRFTRWVFTGAFALLLANSYGQEIFVPAAGNTWVTNQTTDKIDHQGNQQWQDPQTKLTTFFKTDGPGELSVAFVGRVEAGYATINMSLANQSQTFKLTNTRIDTVFVGRFAVAEAGYQQIILQGLTKTARNFARIEGLKISGPVVNAATVYVKDDFYWGRRGPSVHLRYAVPDSVAVVWFYNEITVPEGEDIIGSYFMANGFAEGYFGIQVNSADERRVLFSVWSPFKTDDPGTIPEADKIRLLAKGEGVHTGEFGNEGSGGQSYWPYMWQAGTTYGFLLKGEPAGNGATDFTAYFFAPELGKWQLIAAFRRPKTTTYLTRLHSFLENFVPATGYLSRQAYYSNQWVYTTRNQWLALTKATFTADATARKGARMDFFGGVEGTRFFLQNCGFFNSTLPIGTVLNRHPTTLPPVIDFTALPE